MVSAIVILRDLMVSPAAGVLDLSSGASALNMLLYKRIVHIDPHVVTYCTALEGQQLLGMAGSIGLLGVWPRVPPGADGRRGVTDYASRKRR